MPLPEVHKEVNNSLQSRQSSGNNLGIGRGATSLVRQVVSQLFAEQLFRGATPLRDSYTGIAQLAH